MRNALWTGLAALLGVMTVVGCGSGPDLSNTRRSRLTSQDFVDAQYATHAQYLRETGDSYTAEERYMDAMAMYTDALTLNYGDDFDAQVAMGRLHERDGNKNQALAHYARAKSIRPDHLASWYALRRVKPSMQILPNGEQADGWNPNTATKSDGGDAAAEDDEG